MTDISRIRKRPLEADPAASGRAANEIDIAACATISYSSEDPDHPVEHLLDRHSGPGATRWISARPDTIEHVSRLFRSLFLERLTAAYQAGRQQFFADQAALAQPAAFKSHLAVLRKVEWVVYAKRPFGGPDAVLAYLS